MNKELVEKISKAILGVIVVVIFSFVGTFGVYMQLQQSYCNKNLYSADCYRTYPAFLKKTFRI